MVTSSLQSLLFVLTIIFFLGGVIRSQTKKSSTESGRLQRIKLSHTEHDTFGKWNIINRENWRRTRRLLHVRSK
mgnify:CR=1 FL=1